MTQDAAARPAMYGLRALGVSTGSGHRRCGEAQFAAVVEGTYGVLTSGVTSRDDKAPTPCCWTLVNIDGASVAAFHPARVSLRIALTLETDGESRRHGRLRLGLRDRNTAR